MHSDNSIWRNTKTLLLLFILISILQAIAWGQDKNPKGTNPPSSPISSSEKSDKEEEATLESVYPETLSKYLDKKVKVRGILGDHARDNKNRYELRVDDGSHIEVVGDYPEISHVHYTIHGRVELEGAKYVLHELSKEQEGGTLAGSKIDPLLASGIVLILVALVTVVIMIYRSKEANKKLLMEQHIAEENRRLDVVRIESERMRADAARKASSGGPGGTVVVGSDRSSGAPQRALTIISIGSIEALSGPNAGQKFPLQSGENRVGRLKDKNVTVLLDKDGEVSSYHGSVIVTVDGRILYKDESSNGSVVDGQMIHHGQTDINTGSKIEVGATTLSITLRSSRAISTASESDTLASPNVLEAIPIMKSEADTQTGIPFTSLRSAPTQALEMSESLPNRRASTTQAGFGAEFEVVSGPDAGRRFQISKEITTLGREERDIILNDDTISRSHATLIYQEGEFLIRDERSTHGTLLNGIPIAGEGRILKDGDRVIMGTGSTTLVFHNIS